MGEKGVPAGLYVAVGVVLICYFGWILDRMAAFSTNGFLRLDKLLVGLGLVILLFLVLAGVELVSRRRRRRREPADPAGR
jgi:F0F1-type ATP synthase assembly protein I